MAVRSGVALSTTGDVSLLCLSMMGKLRGPGLPRSAFRAIRCLVTRGWPVASAVVGRASSLTAALAMQSALFWLVLGVRGLEPVNVTAWLALHGVLVLALIGLAVGAATNTRLRARAWLAIAFYAAFIAAFLAGANGALDALHGAHRRRTDVASVLGGLELWNVLFPGVFSLAMGAWVWTLTGPRPRRER